jgi:phosphotransferase system HPr-like phosphotransfer protein
MSDLRDPTGSSTGAARPAAGRKLALEGAAAPALDRVLPEAEYRERLSREGRDLLRLELTLRAGVRGDLSRRFCLRLAEEAERVEYGLLDVGARGNRTFAVFAEAVSTLRWAAKALHALLHLRGRIRRYLGDREDLEPFRRELDGCVAWLSDRVEAVLSAARSEAEGPLALALPDEPVGEASLRGEDVRWRLPQDVNQPETHDERDRIAETAAVFLELADGVERLNLPTADEPPLEELEAVAREAFPPPAAQELRVRMHAVQSTYDSVVAATPLEASDPRLKTFRGYVSILLHLLEAVAYLLQLHARRLDDGRATAARPRIVPLVGAHDLLRWAVKFGLANAALCFREARVVAQALLDRYSRVRELSLDLPPGRRLHLRPAGLIVRVVQHHGLPVEMHMGAQSADARQLMDVILLAAGNPSETAVRFRGDERPLEDLRALFAGRLGEEGLDGLPSSLAYLRQPSKPS